MRVLGLETSCDDTGVAIFDVGRGLLAHGLYSQTPIHAAYGGVVPELASRDHVRKVLPLASALKDFDAWITGRKRYQNDSRQQLPAIEIVHGPSRF